MLLRLAEEQRALRVEGLRYVGDVAPVGATLHIRPFTTKHDGDFVEVFAMADGIVYALSDVYPEHLAGELAYLSGQQQ